MSSNNLDNLKYIPLFLVKPSQPYPLIEICGDHQYCFNTVYEDISIGCSVFESLPMANLSWYRRYSEGDQPILTNMTSSHVGKLRTYSSIVYTNFSKVPQLALFVCKLTQSTSFIKAK